MEPRIVVTAAHCLLDEDGNALGDVQDLFVVGPGADFRLYTGEFLAKVSDVLLGSFRWDPNDRLLEDPTFMASITPSQYWEELGPARAKRSAGDFAVLALSEPLPLRRSVEVATTAAIRALVGADPAATAVGYGTGDAAELAKVPSSVRGQAYVDAASIPGAADSVAAIQGGYEAALRLNAGLLPFQLDSPSDGLCGGDSGGPLLQVRDDTISILGVLAEADHTQVCEDRRGDGAERQWTAFAGGDPLVQLVDRARQVVSQSPVRAGYCETIRSSGATEYNFECWDGKTWANDECYAQPRLTLERFDDGRWVKVKNLKGVRGGDLDCRGRFPNYFSMPMTSPVGGTTYRLVDPRRKKPFEWIFVNRFGPS